MTGEILFLCHRIPFPPDRGDKIRSYNLLKALAQMATVHVGTFADDDRDASFAPDLATIAASQLVVRRSRSKAVGGLRGLALRQSMLVALYDNKELHAWVRDVLATRPIKAVVAYSVQMAHFVPVLGPDVRFLMDFVDFDSAKYAAYGEEQGGPMGWVNRREGEKLFDFERSVAGRADASTFVSGAEASLFRQRIGAGEDGRITHFDNGVDHAFFDPSADFEMIDKGDGPLIVFTGQMDYRPNIDAVESFARNAMPIIRERYPMARFAIVGRNPAPGVEALADLPGIIVTGSVPDVRGWLADADVVVAPLRIARGVQNKVLEAMAMERVVVASPQAAEGIDARNGEHLCVAATPLDEAALVMELLGDQQRAHCIGKAARQRILERYDWSATLAGLTDLVWGK